MYLFSLDVQAFILVRSEVITNKILNENTKVTEVDRTSISNQTKPTNFNYTIKSI